MTEDARSPLHDWHVAHGADIMWEDGFPWNMDQGGDPMAEYEAIRTGTGIWDLFSTCKYEVTGPDAARLINGVSPTRLPAWPTARSATAPSSTRTG